MEVPSQSNQTGLLCGSPFGPMVATWARVAACSRSAYSCGISTISVCFLSSSEQFCGRTNDAQSGRCGQRHFRRTFDQRCSPRLERLKLEKRLFRLFILAEKEVEERLSVLFDKDARSDIRPT